MDGCKKVLYHCLKNCYHYLKSRIDHCFKVYRDVSRRSSVLFLIHNNFPWLSVILFILDPRSQRAGSYKIGAVIVNV